MHTQLAFDNSNMKWLSRMERLLLATLVTLVDGKIFCEKTKMPLEQGEWRHNFIHMDSAVVENHPVSISEGQVYVYENYFPGHTIRYVHVDNVAMKSCGASASIKSGGVGHSSVLVVLHAETNHEIRSVVDIWGTKNYEQRPQPPVQVFDDIKNIKSLYLSQGNRAVNHNKGF